MEEFEILNLTFSYPNSHAPALDGVSLTVHRGEFLTLAGPSGGGKTTLLRLLKPALSPHGKISGTIRFGGEPLEALAPAVQSAQIGFVQQSPDGQLVTDKVWHELAFGLESLGLSTPVIRGRVAETADFFGISPLFSKEIAALSGGQKQLVCLAAVMVMQPSVLLLDEPTSQLDPIAAADFLAALVRLNRELGTTVLLCEHRLEEAMPLSDRVLVLDRGRLLAGGAPGEVGQQLLRAGHSMFRAMPAPVRVWAASGAEGVCPVTVREGRDWLAARAEAQPLFPVPPRPASTLGEPATVLDEVWFRYEKEEPDILKGLSLTVRHGELFAILGGNGSGKTTALRVLAGQKKPLRGSLRRFGSVGFLPQNPQLLFLKKTVWEDLNEALKALTLPPAERNERLSNVVRLCRLEDLLGRHPYDLSGGEQQRAALGKVLLAQPSLLLLDEPTKGLDAAFKQTLAALLRSLTARGTAIVLVSHDVEFCAEFADRCALFFDGALVTEGTPREFFGANRFYTTSVSRMARELVPEAVTVPELAAALGGSLPPEDEPPASEVPPSLPDSTSAASLPLWRRILACTSGLLALALFVLTLRATDFSMLSEAPGTVWQENFPIYAAFLAMLFVLGAAVLQKSAAPRQQERRKISKRANVLTALLLLLIPVTVLFGALALGSRKYYFISLLVLLEAMLLFAVRFEGRRPTAREIVLLACLSALGVAGRAAFFMLPEFKPVVALVILAGVSFGAETGFLTGAMTMLCSNVLFGQGPWTPFQMFAMGLIGFLAGSLFRRIRPTRTVLCVYGAFASVFLYGGILNPAAALLWAHTLNWKILLSYYVTGFPWDLVRAAATVFFLWLASVPILEKFERIKKKYGLLDDSCGDGYLS